jgi:hypothetical protein
MKTRSSVFLSVLTLVLAFGVITGCEGPAGPAGSPGTEGFNQDELAFIHANGFAVRLENLGWTANATGSTVTASTGTVTFDGGEIIPIPDGVTLVVSGGTATVPAGKTLTISGGARSRLVISGNAAIVLTQGISGTEQTKLNITVPTGVTLGHATPITVNTDAEITMSAKTITMDIAMVPDTALTTLGLDPAEIDLVITTTAMTALSAGSPTFKSITVNTGGKLTAPTGGTVTVTGGITLNGGNLVSNTSATFAANIRVTGGSAIETAALILDAGKTIAVAQGGTFTVGQAITAPGGITVAQGGTLAGSAIITAADGITISGGTFTSATGATHAADITFNGGTLGAAVAINAANTITIAAGTTTRVTGAVALSTATPALIVNGTLDIVDPGVVTAAGLTNVEVGERGTIRGAIKLSGAFTGVATLPYSIILGNVGVNAVAMDTAVPAGMSISLPVSTSMTVAAATTIDLSAAGAAIHLGAASNSVVILKNVDSSLNAAGGKLLFGGAGLELYLPGAQTAETVAAVAADAFEAGGSSNISNLPAQADKAPAQYIMGKGSSASDTKGQISITGYGSPSTISAATLWSDNA